jgi:plastocyanin
MVGRWLLMLLIGSSLVGSGLRTVLAGGASVQVNDATGQAIADAVVVLEAPAGATSPPPASRPTATVDQRNLRFVPQISVVRTGTAIDFPNSDKVLHQVYSFSPAKNFKLSLYAGHVHPPLIFDAAGIVTLGCNIHDAMIGFIYVTDSPWFGKTDAAGHYDVERLPAGNYHVLIWHPRLNESTPQLESRLTIPAEGTVPLVVNLTKPMKPPTSDNSTRQWKGY